MLPNEDIGYLFEDNRERLMICNDDPNKDDGLDVHAKSFFQRLSFFGQGCVIQAQSVLTRVAKGVGDCLDDLDKMSMLDEFQKEDVEDMGADSYNLHGNSIFDELTPKERSEHLHRFKTEFFNVYEPYKKLYSQVANLKATYDTYSRNSRSKLMFYIPSYIIGSAFDRSSEVNFITRLLEQEAVISDPFKFEDHLNEDQSIEWYKTHTTSFKIAHALLEGACIYIHQRIGAEYDKTVPNSDLFTILSQIVDRQIEDRLKVESEKEDELTLAKCNVKLSDLNCLLESAQKNTISLSRPKVRATQEVETYTEFVSNCEKFIAELKKEKRDAGYDFCVINDGDKGVASLTL